MTILDAYSDPFLCVCLRGLPSNVTKLYTSRPKKHQIQQQCLIPFCSFIRTCEGQCESSARRKQRRFSACKKLLNNTAAGSSETALDISTYAEANTSCIHALLNMGKLFLDTISLLFSVQPSIRGKSTKRKILCQKKVEQNCTFGLVQKSFLYGRNPTQTYSFLKAIFCSHFICELKTTTKRITQVYLQAHQTTLRKMWQYFFSLFPPQFTYFPALLLLLEELPLLALGRMWTKNAEQTEPTRTSH